MQATDVDRSIDGFLALAKKLRTSILPDISKLVHGILVG